MMKKNRSEATAAWRILTTAVFLWMYSFSWIVAQPADHYVCRGKLACGVPNAEKLGWRVGVQSYTFHRFSLFEAIDMTAALGLHYIEGVAGIGMKLSPESDVTFGPDMPQEWQEKLKQKLAETGVKLVSYYYWMDGSGKDFDKMVAFAKEWNLMLVSDPRRAPQGKPMDYYEQRLKDSGVTMVLTNHPKDAAYWNPDYVLEDVNGRSSYLGGSVDIGHYMRGGFQPLPIVERFGRAGRMYHFHLRDVDSKGTDVALGEGEADIRGILSELYRRGEKPLIMLEYERDFENPMIELVPSVIYLNKVCGDLLNGR